MSGKFATADSEAFGLMRRQMGLSLRQVAEDVATLSGGRVTPSGEWVRRMEIGISDLSARYHPYLLAAVGLTDEDMRRVFLMVSRRAAEARRAALDEARQGCPDGQEAAE